VGYETHLEAGNGDAGNLASGVDCSQVLQRGEAGQRCVVLDDERSADCLQHGQAQLGQLRVLADLHSSQTETSVAG